MITSLSVLCMGRLFIGMALGFPLGWKLHGMKEPILQGTAVRVREGKYPSIGEQDAKPTGGFC